MICVWVHGVEFSYSRSHRLYAECCSIDPSGLLRKPRLSLSHALPIPILSIHAAVDSHLRMILSHREYRYVSYYYFLIASHDIPSFPSSLSSPAFSFPLKIHTRGQKHHGDRNERFTPD